MKIKQLALKGFGKGAEVLDDQLTLISKYTLEEIKAEDLYVRKVRLAHNAIDRDNERFSEELLKAFMETLPGKSFLIGHAWGPPGEGIFFKAELEEMSLEEARSSTGEDIKLPEGVTKVVFLLGWFYTTRTPDKEALLKDIDAGIARHVSIGFNASSRVKEVNEESGETLYWEYKAPGEALEGSLVWLGAQPGATITKGAHKEGTCRCGHDDRGVDIENEDTKKKDSNTEEDEKPMKNLMKALGLPPATEEADAVDAVKRLQERETRLKTYEPVLAELGDDITVETAKTLKANAEDGKVYREDLIKKQVKFERLLKRVGDSDEDVKAREKQLAAKTLDEIKGDIDFLTPMVNAKFPDEGQLNTKGVAENRDDSEVGTKGRRSFRKKKASKKEE